MIMPRVDGKEGVTPGRIDGGGPGFLQAGTGHHRGRAGRGQVILEGGLEPDAGARSQPVFGQRLVLAGPCPGRLAVDFGPRGDASAPGVGANQLDDDRPRAGVDSGKRDGP